MRDLSKEHKLFRDRILKILRSKLAPDIALPPGCGRRLQGTALKYNALLSFRGREKRSIHFL